MSNPIKDRMYPRLFSIGGLPVNTFSVAIIFGLLSALLLWRLLLKNTDWTTEALSNLMLWIMIPAIIGARVAYVIEHINQYESIWGWFQIYNGGLMYYGGFLGAGVGIVIFSRLHSINLLRLLDIVTCALPLGHAFGRIGCFFNGCCYGRATESPLGICFPRGSFAFQQHVQEHRIHQYASHSLPVIPTQLIEAFGNLMILGLLLVCFRKKPRNGTVTGLYLVTYPVLRIFVEYLRADERLHIGGLSIAQTISIGLIGLGIFVLILSRRSPPPVEKG